VGYEWNARLCFIVNARRSVFEVRPARHAGFYDVCYCGHRSSLLQVESDMKGTPMYREICHLRIAISIRYDISCTTLRESSPDRQQMTMAGRISGRGKF
jgi:hypothetical protein